MIGRATTKLEPVDVDAVVTTTVNARANLGVGTWHSTKALLTTST